MRTNATRPGRTTVLAAALLVVVATPAQAGAQQNRKAEAARHFRIGIDAAGSGAYREAIVEFLRAYELSPHYAVLYNVAAAEVALNDSAAALTYFERYLTEGGAAVSAERRRAVNEEIKRHSARTAMLTVVVSPSTARVSVDGAALPGDQLGRPQRVNIGVHKVVATADSYVAAERTVTLASADTETVTLTLVHLAAEKSLAAPSVFGAGTGNATASSGGNGGGATTTTPPPQGNGNAGAATTPGPVALGPTTAGPAGTDVTPPPVAIPGPDRPPEDRARHRVGRTQRIAGLSIAGAGVASAIVAGVFYYRARSYVQLAIDDGCNQDVCNEPGATYYHRGQRDLTISRITGIGGGVLAVAGLVIALTAPSAPPPRPADPAAAPPPPPPAPAPPAVALRPFILADAAGLTLAGRW